MHICNMMIKNSKRDYIGQPFFIEIGVVWNIQTEEL